MNSFEGLRFGLGVALTPENLLAAAIGCFAGSLVGLLPGLGPLAGAAILLPVAFAMDPTAGLIMLAGIYYGVMYGGSTSAVLLNIPGEAPSIVASFDGYQMTKQGRAGPALGVIAISSFIGGTGAVLVVAAISPLLARTALLFGSAEFFALTAGGLILLSRILGGSLGSGLLPMIVGVSLATVGIDGTSGTYRFTFGILEMAQGIHIVPVAIGMFGVTQLIIMAEAIRDQPVIQNLRFKDLLPTKTDLRRAAPSWARGAPLGFGLGLLPGAATVVATFFSYRMEKMFSKNRRQVGTGVVEGIAGPEAANNAAATSAMVPALALGIPFSPVVAVMLGALIVQGITPGPLIMTQNPTLFWGVIASMLIGNVILLIINVPGIRIWVSLLRIPAHTIVPLVLVIATFGAFSTRASMVDIYATLALGLLGYVFVKLGFQPAPLLVGIILGPLMEQHLREGLILTGGDISYFWSRGLAVGIWIVVLAVVTIPAIVRIGRLFWGRGSNGSRGDRTSSDENIPDWRGGASGHGV